MVKGGRPGKLSNLFGNVMDVDRLPVNYGSASGIAAARGPLARHRSRPEPCHQPKHVAIQAKDLSVARATQPCGVLGDYIQHRLNIRWRTGDDAQDLARSSLLLQRLL